MTVKVRAMTSAISFGTSGHRGIIGEDFTTDHVAAIGMAVADVLLEAVERPRLVIGYDPREGNDPARSSGSFTGVLVETLLGRGVDVDFFVMPVPTPLVSAYIVRHGLQGGLILTASHNPPCYNGIKFNPGNGAPASVEVTAKIEAFANDYFKTSSSGVSTLRGRLTLLDDVSEFVGQLTSVLCELGVETSFSETDFFPVVDCKHGTSGAVWEMGFSDLEIRDFSLIHETAVSTFNGIETNPTKTAQLAPLKQAMTLNNSRLGIANDPDADRHVILDENGQLVTPELISVIILDFLVKSGSDVQGIITTVASSLIVKRAAEVLGVCFDETPVGFKYFADFFQSSRDLGKIGLGVESSGGFSVSIHTFEKCGFLPGMIVMGIMAKTGLLLSQLVKHVQESYGLYHFQETEMTYEANKKEVLLNYLKQLDARQCDAFFDVPLASLSQLDGVKLIFTAGSWVLFRFSGTEPLIRIYAESESLSETKNLIEKAQNLLVSQLKP